MSDNSQQTHTIWFADPSGTDHALVGGKGANLGKLANAGFPVPPGFVVGTGAYLAHIDRMRDQISEALAAISYDDADALEVAVERIRGWIVEADMPPAIAAQITEAYAQLRDEDGDVYVAVRSSGTAEDLEGASFAGLHDTYLDIKGADAVLDAVKRDWASLWTARAVAYRKTGGFTDFPSIAVVVQTMVASQVSGVMFTGNPLNAATDEIMLNASWGLGEAVVQGITTPDEYIVRHKGMVLLDRTLGSKEVEIVRNPDTGVGTVQRDVDQARRAEFTLTDEQAEIGAGVQKLYEGFPQDIEWGYADGEFSMLQARPVTGVEFSWDADVTYSVQGNDDPEAVPYDNIWSRVFPEEMWTGAITPLMFSWRCWGLNQCHSVGVHAFGFPGQDHTTRRLWRYHKGVSYYNVEADRQRIKESIPPQLRAGMLHKIPSMWHDEVMNAPFDWGRYLNMFHKVDTERKALLRGGRPALRRARWPARGQGVLLPDHGGALRRAGRAGEQAPHPGQDRRPPEELR
jgi:pyruvate,water dikinase